jgi:hypothetical protein
VNVTLPPPAPSSAADAARLLRELGAEHEKRLVDAMRLDSNHFHAVAQVWRNPMSGEDVFHVHVDLNVRAVMVERAQRRDEAREDFLRGLCDILAKRIAAEILASALNSLPNGGAP